MKPSLFLTALLFSGAVAFSKDPVTSTFHRVPAPPVSAVSRDLFWIADTSRMDRFLAQVNLTSLRADASAGEMLPDTRVAWRDYAREATEFAARGDDAAVNERIGQMLKLAALYRQFGGLQNVVQGEEIRSLAGQTVQALGYGGLIHSPHLESNAGDCVALVTRQAGGEMADVRPIFWRHLLETARQNHARLSGQPNHTLAGVSGAAYAR